MNKKTAKKTSKKLTFHIHLSNCGQSNFKHERNEIEALDLDSVCVCVDSAEKI